MKSFDVTGNISPKESRHGSSCKLSEFEELTVLQTLLTSPGTFLHKVQSELFETGTWIDCSTIWRCVHRWGMSRQKMTNVALQRSDVKRTEFIAKMMQFNTDMFVFVNETGSDRRNSFRKFGYGLKGIPPVSYNLHVSGKRISAIGVLSSCGMEDTYITEGSVNGETFLEFVHRSLIPILQPFDGNNRRSIVVMDTASIHHTQEVTDLITATGALLRFLPPYSLDLNPIELAFSNVKAFLKANDKIFQATHAPRVLVESAFSTITQEDCAGYVYTSLWIRVMCYTQ